uniref:Uncharacterized protein n=1 Tax=Arundo donax TaxID=35708 RepID=A0A0A8XUS8_ARUDO
MPLNYGSFCHGFYMAASAGAQQQISCQTRGPKVLAQGSATEAAAAAFSLVWSEIAGFKPAGAWPCAHTLHETQPFHATSLALCSKLQPPHLSSSLLSQTPLFGFTHVSQFMAVSESCSSNRVHVL